MKKSPVPAPTENLELRETPQAAELELPVAPDFVSMPPQIELAVMLRRIAETMPWRRTRPGEAERRLAEKISAEFVL